MKDILTAIHLIKLIYDLHEFLPIHHLRYRRLIYAGPKHVRNIYEGSKI